MKKPTVTQYSAMDPAALLLGANSKTYLTLIQIWHPNEPSEAGLSKAMMQLAPRERQEFVGRARAMGEFCSSVLAAAKKAV